MEQLENYMDSGVIYGFVPNSNLKKQNNTSRGQFKCLLLESKLQNPNHKFILLKSFRVHSRNNLTYSGLEGPNNVGPSLMMGPPPP